MELILCLLVMLALVAGASLVRQLWHPLKRLVRHSMHDIVH